MHALCTQENLKNALTALERVVGKQSSLPILSNILIETKNGQLFLSATNLEIGVIASLGAKIEREGRVTVPARVLTSFIYNLPESQILELTADGVNLFIKSERHHANFKGVDPKDFPIIPLIQGAYQLSLSAQLFKEAIQKVLFCVSLNESRAELMGVQVQFTAHAAVFAATDSFRLGEFQLSLDEKTESETREELRSKHPSLLIPAPTLQELARIIGQESEKLELAIEDNQLFFHVDGISIVSRLIQGKFPDYEQIIPQKFSSIITIDKTDLLRALKLSSSLALSSGGEVRLILSKNKKEVAVVAESQNMGKNETTLDFEGELVEDTALIFNPRYLLEGVGVLPGERVEFSLNSSTTPTLFRSKDTPLAYRYIVMPIRK